MALIQCPACKMFVTSKGGTCSHCGRPLTDPPAAAKTPGCKPLSPSVGACPGCGSAHTFDRVAEVQHATSSDWLEQLSVSWGAKIKLALTGKGRHLCLDCGHSW